MVTIWLIFLCSLQWTEGTLHEGRRFSFAFPPTHGTAGKCELVLTARVATLYNISIPGASIQEENTPLAGGTTRRYSLAWTMRAPSGLQNNKAVQIRATADIKVEAITLSTGGETDAFLPLPITQDSKEFITVGIWNLASQYSTILVIPSQDNTVIKIFRRNPNGYVKVTEQVIAYMHQVYSWYLKADVTGTVVTANRPVSVIASVQCSYGPPEGGTCDPITISLPPSHSLGRSYIVPPIAGRSDTTGYFFTVVAAHDLTHVSSYGDEGHLVSTLERGQQVTINMNSPIPTSVECSEPCLVAVYNRGEETDHTPTDIFMMLVPSVGQTLSDVDFNTFLTTTGNEFRYYVSILATTTGARDPQFTLNKRPLDVNYWGCVDGSLCEFMYANVTVSHGFYTLTPTSNLTRFLAWTYGHASSGINAYGMITGFNAVNRQIENSLSALHHDLPTDHM